MNIRKKICTLIFKFKFTIFSKKYEVLSWRQKLKTKTIIKLYKKKRHISLKPGIWDILESKIVTYLYNINILNKWPTLFFINLKNICWKLTNKGSLYKMFSIKVLKFLSLLVFLFKVIKFLKCLKSLSYIVPWLWSFWRICLEVFRDLKVSYFNI